MLKIVTVVGARPQFIKAATVSRVIKRRTDIQEYIVHTGQHYDSNMSDIFFSEMDIPRPQINLDVAGHTHGVMTGRMLGRIEGVLIDQKPDWVLVYGDTNSTLAGALAAAKLHIPVAHVEAGLRSFNMFMPEEVNRVLTDRVSSVLLCPTDAAIKNLKGEGYGNLNVSIVKSGDVMQDAALYYATRANIKEVKSRFNISNDFVLCTIHRAENTDDVHRLKNIVAAINEINADKQVVVPLHPRTRRKLDEYGLELEATLIDPLGYLDMISLLQSCNLVITDSGGLQKEAYFFNRPCVTLRDETEWVELIEGGYNRLAGADFLQIIDTYNVMKSVVVEWDADLYGSGNAADKVVEALL